MYAQAFFMQGNGQRFFLLGSYPTGLERA